MAVHVSIKAQAWLFVVTILLTSATATFAADDLDRTNDAHDTSPAASTGYELGHGYRLGNSGFTVGGYTSLQYQNLQSKSVSGPDTSLSHLSMFVWWQSESRVKLFSEIDNQSLLTADEQSQNTGEHFLAVERLYFDYTLNDLLTVRAGKYLTPIGRWNQIHADPLVWTTSRPLITSNIFPDHVSGLMALGNVSLFGMPAEYTVYTSIGTDMRPDRSEGQFNEAYGARLNLPVNENLQVGVSYAGFKATPEPGSTERLVGFDFIWSSQGTELSAETAFRYSSLGAKYDVRGGFLQAVTPIYDKLYLVGRIESLSNPTDQKTTKLDVLGLNYRYSRALSFKMELIHGINQSINDSGFLSSVSVLF